MIRMMNFICRDENSSVLRKSLDEIFNAGVSSVNLELESLNEVNPVLDLIKNMDETYAAYSYAKTRIHADGSKLLSVPYIKIIKSERSEEQNASL